MTRHIFFLLQGLSAPTRLRAALEPARFCCPIFGGKIANKPTATLSMSALVISTVSHANRIIWRGSLRFLGQRPFCFCSERLDNALSRHRALLAQHPLRLSADKRFRFVG